MELQRPIADIIRARTSWRAYANEALDEAVADELRTTIADCPPAPFGATVRVALLEAFDARQRGVEKLGTYGVITGATTYLVGVVDQSEHALEDFGFVFEHLILRATDLGLATCWLGGTFQRTAFAEAVGVGPGEQIPAVSPVGRPRGRRSLVDHTFRLFARATKRKPWSQLFFAHSGHPLTPDEAGPYAEVLELVRRAPSASNFQPWRLVASSELDGFSLFLRRTPGYRQRFSADLQRIDMGIAMSHFELAARANGIEGSWALAPASPPRALGTVEYVATWK